MEYFIIPIPILTCDLSLPNIKNANGNPEMVSISTQALFDALMGGFDGLKRLITDPIAAAIANMGK